MLALVVAARKLRPYFQAHAILVPTSHPLRQVLQNPKVFGRLTKWTIELGEFDIKFMPMTIVKGQAIADFVAEFTYLTKALGVTATSSTSEGRTKDDEPTDLNNVWSLRIDGSSNVNGSGAGVILESPTGEKVDYALRLEFLASNNEAEHKALLARLCLAKEMRVEQIRIYNDSQLVVNQINEHYQAKEERGLPRGTPFKVLFTTGGKVS